MADMERDLRNMMERTADGVHHVPRPSRGLIRRAHLRRARTIAIAGTATLILVIGGFAGARSLSSDEALPPANPDSKKTESSGGMWPQSSPEEGRRAQRLADAGDPRYTWQVFPEWPPYDDEGKPAVEPGDVKLFTRFLQEKLGWEEFSWGVGPDPAPPISWPVEFVVVRCAPGETNALYPNDTDGRECAPTLGENRYETVRIRADQPDTFGGNLRPSGIWVVAEWEMLQPPVAPVTGIEVYRHQIRQMEPISEGKATELLRAFLQARVDGEGAERYVNGGIGPLMYATTAGDPYERFEFELVRGPVWPSGWMEFKVRLFAVGGRTEVEQLFVDRKEDGRLVVLVISSSDDEIAYGEI